MTTRVAVFTVSVFLAVPAQGDPLPILRAEWFPGLRFEILANDGFVNHSDANVGLPQHAPITTTSSTAEVTGTQGVLDSDYVIEGVVVLEEQNLLLSAPVGTYSGIASAILLQVVHIATTGSPLALVPVDGDSKSIDVSYIAQLQGAWNFGNDLFPFDVTLSPSATSNGGLSFGEPGFVLSDDFDLELGQIAIDSVTYSARLSVGFDATVPEPSTGLLFGFGLLAFAACRRERS